MKTKKTTLSERIRRWDADSFDLTDRLPVSPPLPEDDHAGVGEDPADYSRSTQLQLRRFDRLYPWMAALLCAVMIAFLLLAVLELPAFGAADAPPQNEVAERYISRGMEETGAVNVVAGVILDYRAFDTLGESHVLYTAALAVMILLVTTRHLEEESEAVRGILERDTILRRTARILVPVVLLFGLYIIFNGHLGPGGGFSGGAVIGGALILYAIAFGFEKLEKVLNLRIYRIVVACALCFYSAAKCYSFYCGANHLETIFRTGTPGAIFSAGLILPLNIAVGIVVACTMYGFYSLFQRGRI
jgi:multicomponent Na+:H+ antiporter subunit B